MGSQHKPERIKVGDDAGGVAAGASRGTNVQRALQRGPRPTVGQRGMAATKRQLNPRLLSAYPRPRVQDPAPSHSLPVATCRDPLVPDFVVFSNSKRHHISTLTLSTIRATFGAGLAGMELFAHDFIIRPWMGRENCPSATPRHAAVPAVCQRQRPRHRVLCTPSPVDHQAVDRPEPALLQVRARTPPAMAAAGERCGTEY